MLAHSGASKSSEAGSGSIASGGGSEASILTANLVATGSVSHTTLTRRRIPANSGLTLSNIAGSRERALLPRAIEHAGSLALSVIAECVHYPRVFPLAQIETYHSQRMRFRV